MWLVLLLTTFTTSLPVHKIENSSDVLETLIKTTNFTSFKRNWTTPSGKIPVSTTTATAPMQIDCANNQSVSATQNHFENITNTFKLEGTTAVSAIKQSMMKKRNHQDGKVNGAVSLTLDSLAALNLLLFILNLL